MITSSQIYLFSTDPYRMVIVNLIAIVITSVVLFIYIYIYPKKRISYFTLLIIFSVLPLISITRSGTYESGDMTINAIKTISFVNSLNDGQLIPHWSENLNATYGYPNFIFAYPLPYYLTSLFHFLGFSYINSVKVILIFSYLASGIAMYLFLKSIFSVRSAFIGSIIYQFAPYHLINMHFRVDIGEMTALVFVPLLCLFINNAIRKHDFLYAFLASFSLMFLILSHQAISLIAAPLIFLFGIFRIFQSNNRFKKKLFGKLILIFIFGLSFSAFYWLPVLIESKYTFQDYPLRQPFPFLTISEILYSKWRFGLLFQGSNGEIKPLIGYVQMFIIFIAIFLLIKKKVQKHKLLLLFSLFAFFVYALMLINLSLPIWNLFSILKKMQFSYRFMSVVIFIISVIAAIVSENIKSKTFMFLIVSAGILSTILNWGNRGMVEMNDQDLLNQLPLSTHQHEGLHPAAPKWFKNGKMWKDAIPISHIEGINTDLKVLVESRNSVRHEYLVKLKSDGVVRENTVYFPGWKVFVDGVETKIDFEDEDNYGIITFKLSRGYHNIELKFQDTLVRKFSLILSGFTLLVSGLILIRRQNNPHPMWDLTFLRREVSW